MKLTTYIVKGTEASPNDVKITRYKKSFWIKTSFTISMVFIIVSSLSSGLFTLHVTAHPLPISYKPHPNEIFNMTSIVPQEVVIKFTERPELKASSFKVMNSNQVRIDNNDLMLVSDRALSVSLDESNLQAGNYSVYWSILSKDDGFQTKGYYTFSIIK